MKRAFYLFFAMFSLVAMTQLLSSNAIAGGQSGPEKLDAATLKVMIDNLGYTSKVLNTETDKEKYQITLAKNDLNIPIGLEISPSKNYVWLTVNLGDAPTGSSSKFEALLKENFNIQPSLFYITTKGLLMMAIPMENRYITPQNMKRNIEKISDDVGKTKSVWQG